MNTLSLREQSVSMFILIVSIVAILFLYIPKGSLAGEDITFIPKEAIRLRILANSNSPQDQEIKRIVRDRVNAQITEWVQDLTTLEEARMIILGNLGEIQAIAEQVLEEKKSAHRVETKFGKVRFPTKLYGNFLYPAGDYEAILITIGEGKGANWWCVLFPPLCFLDFSTGTAVSDGFEDDEPYTETKEQERKNIEEFPEEKNPPIYDGTEETVKVKFFIFELIKRIMDFFTSLFA